MEMTKKLMLAAAVCAATFIPAISVCAMDDGLEGEGDQQYVLSKAEESRQRRSLLTPGEKMLRNSDLRSAVCAGNLDKARTFLEAGADANANDHRAGSYSPLILVIRANRSMPEMAKLLIAYNADMHATDFQGFTPLLNTLGRNGHEEVAKVLIRAKANVNQCFDTNGLLQSTYKGRSPLMEACKTGKINAVRALLSANANPELVDVGGYTALLWAMVYGHGTIVKTLINANAAVNYNQGAALLMQDKICANKEGRSPLMFACDTGQPDIMQTLLDAGACLHTVSKEGDTVFDSFKHYFKWRDRKADTEPGMRVVRDKAIALNRDRQLALRHIEILKQFLPINDIAQLAGSYGLVPCCGNMAAVGQVDVAEEVVSIDARAVDFDEKEADEDAYMRPPQEQSAPEQLLPDQFLEQPVDSYIAHPTMEFFSEDQRGELAVKLWQKADFNGNLRQAVAVQIADDYAAEVGIDLRAMAAPGAHEES